MVLNFSKNNGVAVIKFNRPDKFNSFNKSLAMKVQEALDDCANDDQVRVIILTGEGKAFCAGQDLAEATDPNGPPLKNIVGEHYNPIIKRLRKIEKPIIAAVNGVAAGAGANIALACDIVIAKNSAKFIQAFSAIGLIPDSGGTYFLPRLVGKQKALALMMTGDRISAEEAEKMNMIYKAIEDEGFDAYIEGFSARMAQMPTYGLGLTKKAVNESFNNTLDEQLDLEEELQFEAGQSHDFKEGTAAFLEKRKPKFTGKKITMEHIEVGVLGAGTMGAGIAQVAAQSGHRVILIDVNESALEKAKNSLTKIFNRLVEKGKWTDSFANETYGRITFSKELKDFANCGIIIEAIIENIEIKHKVVKEIETIVGKNAIIASNTSSLSIASIGSVLEHPERTIGIHFFNPAPLMPLVEIIPAVQTSEETTKFARSLIDSWKKVTVLAKDTPGFIVNRVARPFYGEALRIYEEGIADFATIDWAMTELGGFRMGPFTLMDYIGNDVNYTVTETVFAAFYYDPRYKPSFTQKRHSEAGYLGRKSGRGYYDYSTDSKPEPNKDKVLGEKIFNRILVMLINEAIDALFLNIASKEDIDLAMTKGVNYPKGLLKWADEIGLEKVLNDLEALFHEYGEDRYRPSPLLRKLVRVGESIF